LVLLSRPVWVPIQSPGRNFCGPFF
jgi:hypothetical protein